AAADVLAQVPIDFRRISGREIVQDQLADRHTVFSRNGLKRFVVADPVGLRSASRAGPFRNRMCRTLLDGHAQFLLDRYTRKKSAALAQQYRQNVRPIVKRKVDGRSGRVVTRPIFDIASRYDALLGK